MTTEESSHRKKIRGGHRAYVTRLIHLASQTLEEFNPENVNDREKILQYQRTLTERLEILKGLDATILESVKATEIEAEIQEAGEFAAQILMMMILVKFNTVLHVNRTAPYSGSPSVNTGNSNEHSHGATASACKPKLPKLSLRKFYGDPTSWVPWWDSFNSAVHSNESLSSADKFDYLRSLLDGQAVSAITVLQLTAKNYEDAIEIL